MMHVSKVALVQAAVKTRRVSLLLFSVRGEEGDGNGVEAVDAFRFLARSGVPLRRWAD